MSKKFIGIGVVVAAIAASVVLGGYMMQEQTHLPASPHEASPELPPVSEPAPEPLRPIEPTSAPAKPQRQPRTLPETPARPVPVVATIASPAETPAATAVQPETPVPSPRPLPVVDPPTADPVAPPAERYVPDPATALQPAPAAEPEPQFEELTVERHAVIGIRLDHSVSTRTAKVEDRISATVSRNVTVNDRVAIPEGARLEGTVTAVDRGGKFRDRPRLGLQFDTMILTDGTRMSIQTDAIVREGDSPSADAAAKVGAGSAVGAILGGLLGGKKGAIIGGAAGAASGTAAVMNGDGNETALKAGAPLTVRLTEDLTVVVRKL